MDDLLADLDAGASWIAAALKSSGYTADFSGHSLREIDRFFDEHSHDGRARSGGLLAEDLGQRIFAIGAYVGEVVRRASGGGAWSVDGSSPQAEIDVELKLPDGGTIWPVQRVMKRFQNGAEDSIAAYGAALGVDLGPPPAPSADGGRRRWFRRG